MHSLFGTSVLLAAVSFCVFTSWRAATAPADFAGMLGLKLANQGGGNEVRAQYAGFFGAVAAACAAALAGILPRETAFFLLIIVFGGLFAGRMASLLLDNGTRGYPPAVRALFAIDAFGLSLAWLAQVVDPNG